MDEVDASIVRECGVPLQYVEEMGLYEKMLVLGYRVPERVEPFRDVKPPERRLPRKV